MKKINKYMKFIELYKADLIRYNGQCGLYLRCFHYSFRKAQTVENKYLKLYYKLLLKIIESKRGIEISSMVQIGKGLYIGHAYNITVNPECVLGENINIHKGCTLGNEYRGERQGAPIIGNDVWIGINASVVGCVRVGNDVLIAANSFVNRDIPSHSIVFGNPCVIRPKKHATEGYINNKANQI